MAPHFLYFLLFMLPLYSCDQGSVSTFINPQGTTIESRFLLPEGFTRKPAEPGSWKEYLRKRPLKQHGSKVKYHTGEIKDKIAVYDAVIDMPIGKRDLHQCADAVMHLKADYHWRKKEYDKIHFNFLNGFRADYTKWMNGYRIKVNGNSTSWYKADAASESYHVFWKYLEIVFAYANTYSLEQELMEVSIDRMKIGDVFMRGGNPGHVVIVVDMAENKTTGEKLFLLAQSYMPAQEIQILKNPNNRSLSPWYSANMQGDFRTPEWNFHTDDLMRFPE